MTTATLPLPGSIASKQYSNISSVTTQEKNTSAIKENVTDGLKKVSLATLDYLGAKTPVYNKIIDVISKKTVSVVNFAEGFFLPKNVHTFATYVNSFCGKLTAGIAKAFPQVTTFGAPLALTALRTEVAKRNVMKGLKKEGKGSDDLLLKEATKLGFDTKGGVEALRAKPETVEMISQKLSEELVEKISMFYKEHGLGKLSLKVNGEWSKEESQLEKDKAIAKFKEAIKERLYGIMRESLSDKEFNKAFSKLNSEINKGYGITKKTFSAAMYATCGVITAFGLWDDIGRVVGDKLKDVGQAVWDHTLGPIVNDINDRFVEPVVDTVKNAYGACRDAIQKILHPLKTVGDAAVEAAEVVKEHTPGPVKKVGTEVLEARKQYNNSWEEHNENLREALEDSGMSREEIERKVFEQDGRFRHGPGY